MDADLKKILKAVVLEMRHELEGYYDNAGKWHPGDLETRLAEIGVRKDRASVPVDELGRLTDEDVRARKIVDAFIDVREQAGVDRAEAVAEYIRESAYTWANRLVALRCMEARELLDDEVIVGREAYGGRSLVHHRLALSSPELCTGEDDGRFAMLAQVFSERARTLPMLFDPDSPSIALRPSPAALKNCLAWLSGTQKVRSQEPATDAVFAAPDALGWAYQYWNTEEKNRVFEMVRTKKGAKIEGADIIPATQLYTEDYMVKFLVQNSLGATWMGMHPESKLFEGWEYYVRDADRALVKTKPLQQITLLDPACGSGHFLIEAFDMFYAMYEEEGSLKDPEAICSSILENNLFGIDIDERSIQIAEASLWMKAEEKSFGFCGANTNLVAATSSHLKGESWERYLAKLKKEPSTVRVLRRFATEMEHIDELGSLARPAEALESIINEEHEIWEKQERERREANKSLFQEIRDDLLASQLPFQDISDKEFFARTMRHALFAIDGFTAEARESGEFNDQLMGVEAKTGFRLLDLLSRKYDVVVANPPYMGAKSAGKFLKAYMFRSFPEGKRDLFSCFIQRTAELLTPMGKAGHVTMQAWLFQSAFEDLRQKLLSNYTLELFAKLGPGAFQEIGGQVVAVVLSVIVNSEPVPPSTVSGITCAPGTSPSEKAQILRYPDREIGRVTAIKQDSFNSFPNCAFLFWLPDGLRKILQEKPPLSTVAIAKQGACTSNDTRFLRYRWEHDPHSLRWRRFAKGGGFSRWWGNEFLSIDWEHSGKRPKTFTCSLYGGTHWSVNIKNADLYGREGWSYGLISSGSMSLRRMVAGSVFGHKGPAVFASNGHGYAIAAYLNSALATYFLRQIAPAFSFETGAVMSLPWDDRLECDELATLASGLVEIRRMICRKDICEAEFDPCSAFANDETGLSCEDVIVFLLQQRLDSLVAKKLMLSICDLQFVSTEVGQTSIFKYEGSGDSIALCIRGASLSDGLSRVIEYDELRETQESPLPVEVRDQIFELYKDGPDAALKRANEFIAENRPGSFPIPADSFLENISRATNVHPAVVFNLIQEGVKSEGWQCIDLKCERFRTQLTVLALGLIGHQWNGSSFGPALSFSYSDDDGIIPLTGVSKESDLHQRVDECLHAQQIKINSFSDVMGKSVGDWLNTEFFKYHTKQFKKRPIAWQFQSSSFTSRKSPAFACLAYYHRVDVDAIPKVRSQYVGPLKLRFETEMRGISSTPAAARTDSQAKRAVELEEAITELQAFEEKLGGISKSGFGPAKLLPTLRQYAFDDAMLSMKACWLKRLSKLLDQSPGEEADDGRREPSPLEDWQGQAIGTGLHPDLDHWIGEALSNLSYFCSQVGPKAPNAKRTPQDPTAVEFAEMIQAEAADMQTGSMKLACGVWWGKFDAAVLAPIRERIKILKAEQKELNAAIKEDRQPVMVAEQILEGSAEDGVSEVARVTNDMPLFGNDLSFEQTIELTKAAMKARLKEVKTKIKKFTEEMDSKAGKAQAIRDAIQAWQLPDPLPALLDFSPSSPNLPPLFDQVSSLDERRSPPKTIAEFIAQESLYAPDINDGVRVNIAPLQKAGVLAADVLAPKDVDKAIADRAEWRADERRWVREGKLPQPGWWKVGKDDGGGMTVEETDGSSAPTDGVACKQFVSDGKEDK